MISTVEIIQQLEKEFRVCVPLAEHYVNGLPKEYKTPCFLYLLVFSGDVREMQFVKTTTLDLQVVYFEAKESIGQGAFQNKWEVLDRLKQFLSKFMLGVGDRNIKFEYYVTEADGQLTINIRFKFKDGVINPQEAYEAIQNIAINGKEV